MFKYSKRTHIDKLLNRGILRIGTLHEYRDTKYQEGIHDNTEGIKTVHVTRKELDFKSKDIATQRILNDFLGGLITGEGSLIMSGDAPMFVKKVSNENHLVFCASFEHTPSILEIFKYDAGIEITHPDEFIKLVSDKLKKKLNAELVYFDKVKYQKKEEEWNHFNYGYHPMIIKDKSFAYQNEIRAIWRVPNNTKLTHQILRIPELKKYCKLLKLG